MLGLVILLIRRFVPESPRWLMTHGRAEEAERIVAEIERKCAGLGDKLPPPSRTSTITIRPRGSIGFGEIARRHARATTRGARCSASSLMVVAGVPLQRDLLHLRARAHAVLRRPERRRRAVHPAVRARQLPRPAPARAAFRHGRPAKSMIAGDLRRSPAVLLVVTGVMFAQGLLTATTQTIAWCGDLLLRLGGGQLGVPDGQRDLPARDARAWPSRSSTPLGPRSAESPARCSSARSSARAIEGTSSSGIWLEPP